MANQYLPGTIMVPSQLLVTTITRAYPMVVTVDVSNPVAMFNNYIVGMAVRLTVPVAYGMFQADGLVGTIIEISNFDFSLNLDSRSFDAFVDATDAFDTQPASLSPAGSRNYQYNNDSRKVPFQSLNNQGN